MATTLYILWEKPQPRTFANEVEAHDAALRTDAPLYSIDPDGEWRLHVIRGAMIRGGPVWVNGAELPLRLWHMGIHHRRSGQ
jgi:hypothetical protein